MFAVEKFLCLLLVIAFLTGKTFQMIDVSSCSHYHLERRYDFVTRRTVAGVSEEPGQKKKRRKGNEEKFFSMARRGAKKNIHFDSDGRNKVSEKNRTLDRNEWQ